MYRIEALFLVSLSVTGQAEGDSTLILSRAQ
jgi:hypothetical protein